MLSCWTYYGSMWLNLIIDKTFYSFIRAENWVNLLWGGATSISDGILYSNHTCSKNVHFPTLCPKGTQKPINLNSSPKCWHDISNTKLFIQVTYISQIVGSIYEYCYTIFTYIYFPKILQQLYNKYIYCLQVLHTKGFSKI